MTSTYTGTYSRMPSMWKAPKRGGARDRDDLLADLLIRVLQPTVPLPGAACRGKAHLFDPDAPAELHAQAVEICAGCPIAAQCADWVASQARNTVSGVLGGNLYRGPYPRSARRKATP